MAAPKHRKSAAASGGVSEKERIMGQLLLEKARARRVEALWAKRVGACLKAEIAITQTAEAAASADRSRAKLFSAQA